MWKKSKNKIRTIIIKNYIKNKVMSKIICPIIGTLCAIPCFAGLLNAATISNEYVILSIIGFSISGIVALAPSISELDGTEEDKARWREFHERTK